MYHVALTESLFPAQTDTAFRAMTVAAMLREQAAAHGDRPALEALDADGTIVRVWTYAGLLADAEQLARALVSRHSKDARIAIFAHNVPEWVLMELAVALAGMTLVTINPAYGVRELSYVLEQSRSEAIYFVDEVRGNPVGEVTHKACDALPSVRHRVRLTDHEALFAGHERGADLPDTAPGDIVQIQYTSGTTGFPKGALLHQMGLIQNGIDSMSRAGVGAGDRFVHMMPLFHTAGCAIMVLGGLGVGAAIVLAPGFDPALVTKVIERERPMFFMGVPTMIVALFEEAAKSGRDVSSITRIMSGGAMVAPELVRRSRAIFGCPIQIIYGQTESSPVISMAWSDDSDEDLSGTIGQPLPHVEVSIRTLGDNTLCAPGEQGEICCRGYLVMAGYNDNPDATAAAIDSEGWLHTGDLGRMDSRGYLTITGRVKEMIIRGGENLFPAEIENVMLEHEAIAEVAVVGIPDAKWGEQVACFMRAGGSDRPEAAELKRFIRERLSPQKTPAFWIWVDEWPLTGSGKIKKFALRDRFGEGGFEVLTT